ncbi:hypothetical protein JB92DRAFT_2921798 [Gautieria morchelliformis]|nr:hypothetical protein JB92DRAFT_2921798 [Gautieria morchelliformis]
MKACAYLIVSFVLVICSGGACWAKLTDDASLIPIPLLPGYEVSIVSGINFVVLIPRLPTSYPSPHCSISPI